MAVKPNSHREVFTLTNRQYITTNYIRLSFTHPNIAVFKDTTIGVNNKIFLAPNANTPILLPSNDPEVQIEIADQDKPIMRTYTHRGINLDKKELYIDFVVHDDGGPGSEFACNAQIGAKLGIAMGVLPKELVPKVDYYLLAGDATAIPVIGAILESLDSESTAEVYIEVVSEMDIQVLKSQAKVNIQWIVHPSPGLNSPLYSYVIESENIHSVQQSRFAYIASEFSSVKQLRHLFRKELKWETSQIYAYSYWKHGQAESASVADRRAEKQSLE